VITVVTGASGFVGATLIRTLLDRGHRVRGVDLHRGPALDGLDIEWAVADVRDRTAVDRALDGASMVFHTAAVISVAGDPTGRVWDVNVNGVRTVAEAALAAAVDRFVHCSSVHAFDLEVDATIDESSPKATAPSLPVYDRSKAAGEEVLADVAGRGLDTVVCNPTGILGPFDYAPSRMGAVLLSLFNGTMRGLVDGGFNWVDVRDVAAGLIDAAERAPAGGHFLLPGHHRTLAEIARVTAAVSGVPAPRLVAPMWFARAIGPLGAVVNRRSGNPLLPSSEALHALRYCPPVSGERAAAVFGYRPTPFETTIADAYAWFRDRGMLDHSG
jgi:dihydroflavonol-4-reductase